MCGLLSPEIDDFFIDEGHGGKVLCTKIRGMCLMLFYSTRCVYCKKLIPIFKNLPNYFNGAFFAMANISRLKDLCKESKDTNTPIIYVPYILLYVDHKPYMKYNGPHDINEIKKFVIEASQSIQKKNSFGRTPEQENRKSNEIPEYTVGKPLCGDGKCYLNFDDAYTDTDEDYGFKHSEQNQSPLYKGYEEAYVEEKNPEQQYHQFNKMGKFPPRRGDRRGR